MADAYTFVYICAFSLQNLPKGAGNVGSLNLSYISKVSPHSSTHTVSQRFHLYSLCVQTCLNL